MEEFDQPGYWRKRVSGQSGLRAVGHRSLGQEYNRWIYRRRLEVLNETLEQFEPDIGTSSVLDLGCGTGFYEEFWQARGVRNLCGLDISEENIALLKSVYPEFRFAVADLTASPPSASETFDVITLFDVLYHLVDDIAARNAIAYAAAHLTSGRLLLFDQLLNKDYSLRQHVKFRSRAHIDRLLAAHGLAIESETRLFVLLEPPIYGIRIVDLPVATLYFLAGAFFRAAPPLGRIAGAIVYSLDRALRRVGVRTPNHALYVVKRVAEK